MDAIEQINGEDAFVSLREDAWHRKGNVVQDLTMAEFLPAARLANWNVTKEPMRLSLPSLHPTDLIDGPTDRLVDVEDRFVTVRNLDGKVLGANVGPQYDIFSCEDMLSLAEAVAGEGVVLQPETGGSIKDGKWVFLTFTFPDDLWTLDDDPHQPYFAMLNSFDMSLALTNLATLTRIVCWNTANLALSRAYGTESARIAAGRVDTGVYRVKHRSGMRERVEEVRKALGMSRAYFKRYATFADEAMHARLGTREFDLLLDAIFPVGDDVSPRALTGREKSRTTIRNLYEDSVEVGKFGGTQWGALQSVSTFEQWVAPIKTGKRDEAEVRAERQIDAAVSGGFPLTEKAKSVLLAQQVS